MTEPTPADFLAQGTSMKELSTETDYEDFKPMPGIIQNSPTWERAAALARLDAFNRVSQHAHRNNPVPKSPEEIRAEREVAHRKWLAERKPFKPIFSDILTRLDESLSKIKARDLRLLEADAGRISYFPDAPKRK